MDKEKLMTEEEWLAKYNAGQKKSKKKSIRKWVRNGVALGMVAVLSIAGTLAYLKKTSNTKTNTFTGSAGLRLLLTESKWDPLNSEANINVTPGPEDPMAKAEQYIPGNTYAKNPQLINWGDNAYSEVSKDVNNAITEGADVVSEDPGTYAYKEYVAIKVDLLDGSGNGLTYSQITNVIEDIVFKNNNWMLIAYKKNSTWVATDYSTKTYFKSTPVTDVGKFDTANVNDLSSASSFVFAYGSYADSEYQYTQLNAQYSTHELFSSIAIKQDIMPFAGGDVITDPTNYPTFKIQLSGAAIDTDSYSDNTQAQIRTDLLKVLNITI